MRLNISFLGLLCIVFITLKLLGHITWSWVWVLSPLWAPFGVAVIILAVAIIAKVILEVVK